MTRQLTKEALEAIINNYKGLYSDVCSILGVKFISLPKVIQRTPNRLAHYDVVLKVSEILETTPEKVLTEPVEASLETFSG